jgi:hypothetical protein
MLKNLALTSASAVLALALAGPAAATLDLSFQNGATVFTCADQTSCDLDGAVKNLLLLNTMVGDIRIEGTFAASVAGLHNNLQTSNLTITNEGSSTETLIMAVGDTDFTPSVHGVRESASLTFNNDTGETSTLEFFADAGNGQPGGDPINVPGSLLFSTSGTATISPDSFSGTHDSVVDFTDPFSMTEWASLTLLPGASVTGFNESMTSSVPEPRTWAMAALGFGLLSALGFKRSRRNRLATI